MINRCWSNKLKESKRLRYKCTVLKPVISFDTFLSYEPVQDLSTRVAVDCHCDATRLTFMFQILKLIVDTAMVSANLVSKIQQTVTLVTCYKKL